MKNIATKCQVTAAAVGIGAAAVFAPVAANAAPAVQVTTAPVHQLIGDLPLDRADRIFFRQVVSIQLIGASIRRSSERLERKVTRLEAYAAANPGTFFGNAAAQRAARLESRLAGYGSLSLSACNDGVGVQLGPYGTVTEGPC